VKSTTPASDVASSRQAGRAWLGVVALLGLAIAAAWHNSLHAPFVLDDLPAIVENPSLLHVATVLSPPRDGQTVTGRPLLNLSFSINRAMGGEAVEGYHLVNCGLHFLAALALFGVVRRTLLQPALAPRFGADALPLAAVASLLWAVHPLTTESVTYIAQRATSLASLCYLSVLYGFIRSTSERIAIRRWQAFAVAMCLAGMASKEIVASAPLIVLLYDRTFVAGSVRAALKSRRGFYLALAATWILLAVLTVGAGTRGETAGFGLGISVWSYLLTQCRAIVHYLRLVFWPQPLVFDYGFQLEPSLAAVAPQAILLVMLLGATAFAVAKKSPLGFAGVCFFALLAPSSSIVPVVTQTSAEHRMYLPLAAVIVPVVLAAYAYLGRRTVAIAGAAIAIALATTTVRRNADYQSALTLWQDTVKKCPTNSRAFSELGLALFQAGQPGAAIAALEKSVQLWPGNAMAHFNLAVIFIKAGRLEEARQQYELAARALPKLAAARYGVGNVLVQLGRPREAIPWYEESLRLDPTDDRAHNNLGNVLELTGRRADAVEHFRAAIRLDPQAIEPRFNLANALVRLGRAPEAIAEYEALLQLAPDHVNAHLNLGTVLVQTGRALEGVAQFEAALRLDPGNTVARRHLEATQPRSSER
jgi:tetratricopeptide (TPR) repeat protein